MISSLIGFTDDSIFSLETMSLHVIFGDELYSKTIMTKFMVVGIPSMYNIIIGRSMLNRLRAIV